MRCKEKLFVTVTDGRTSLLVCTFYESSIAPGNDWNQEWSYHSLAHVLLLAAGCIHPFRPARYRADCNSTSSRANVARIAARRGSALLWEASSHACKVETAPARFPCPFVN